MAKESLADRLKKMAGFHKAEEDEGREPEQENEGSPEDEREDEGEMDEKAFRKAMAKYMSDKPEELAKMLKAGGAKFLKMMKDEMPEMAKAFVEAAGEIVEKIDLESQDGKASGIFINGDEFAKAIMGQGEMQTQISAHALTEISALRRDITAIGEFLLANAGSPMAKAFGGVGQFPGGVPEVKGVQAAAKNKGSLFAKASTAGWSSIKQTLFKMASEGNEMAANTAIELDMVSNDYRRLSPASQQFLANTTA